MLEKILLQNVQFISFQKNMKKKEQNFMYCLEEKKRKLKE